MKSLYKFMFLIILYFFCIDIYAGNYIFKFVYGFGIDEGENTLVYYQLVENSGNKMEKVPVQISNNQEVILKINQKEIKAIQFSGHAVASNGIRKSLLLFAQNISNLKKGKEINIISLIAASEGVSTPIPIGELIQTLSEQRYNELLKKDTSKAFNYSNFFPIGRFIVYDPVKKESGDAYFMPKTNPYFIESTKSILDHYVLKKELGVNLNVGYQRLNVATNTEKQQYIEYIVIIDTIQIQHWQSNTSEMKYLDDEVKNGNLNFLKRQFSDNPNLKFYFISACVMIKDFTIFSAVHDSLGSTTTANLDIPAGTSSLQISGGVVYTLTETAKKRDKTSLYYTSFAVRDYSSYIKNLFSNQTLEVKIKGAKEDLRDSELVIKSKYMDLQKLDPLLAGFDNAGSIISFSQLLNLKEYIAPDEFPAIDEETLKNLNMQISQYNGLLMALKGEVSSYGNLKSNYNNLLLEAQSEELEISKLQPTPIILHDDIVEEAFKNKVVRQ